MTYLLPSLNGLRAFEAAARHLSFKLAAQELHVTPSAVSVQVKGLELRLGVQLFQRLHKQLVLTDAGETYLEQVRESFVRIAKATRNLKPREALAMLTIGVRGSFDVSLLDIAGFRSWQPRIGARIAQPAGLRELLEGKVDVAIERGVSEYPGYRCDPLDTVGPAAANYYLICARGLGGCEEIELLRSWVLGKAKVTHLVTHKRLSA
jgi:LysR family transcriptional regulator, glycine cleavage system transcriptional activator